MNKDKPAVESKADDNACPVKQKETTKFQLAPDKPARKRATETVRSELGCSGEYNNGSVSSLDPGVAHWNNFAGTYFHLIVFTQLTCT